VLARQSAKSGANTYEMLEGGSAKPARNSSRKFANKYLPVIGIRGLLLSRAVPSDSGPED
jgi:hypothetical protein